jgi:hypothetical protein
MKETCSTAKAPCRSDERPRLPLGRKGVREPHPQAEAGLPSDYGPAWQQRSSEEHNRAPDSRREIQVLGDRNLYGTPVLFAVLIVICTTSCPSAMAGKRPVDFNAVQWFDLSSAGDSKPTVLWVKVPEGVWSETDSHAGDGSTTLPTGLVASWSVTKDIRGALVAATAELVVIPSSGLGATGDAAVGWFFSEEHFENECHPRHWTVQTKPRTPTKGKLLSLGDRSVQGWTTDFRVQANPSSPDAVLNVVALGFFVADKLVVMLVQKSTDKVAESMFFDGIELRQSIPVIKEDQVKVVFHGQQGSARLVATLSGPWQRLYPHLRDMDSNTMIGAQWTKIDDKAGVLRFSLQTETTGRDLEGSFQDWQSSLPDGFREAGMTVKSTRIRVADRDALRVEAQSLQEEDRRVIFACLLKVETHLLILTLDAATAKNRLAATSHEMDSILASVETWPDPR